MFRRAPTRTSTTPSCTIRRSRRRRSRRSRIKTPQVSRPQISAPQISTPQISRTGRRRSRRPQVSAPQVSAPQISAPQISAHRTGRTAQRHRHRPTPSTTSATPTTVYDAFLNVPNVGRTARAAATTSSRCSSRGPAWCPASCRPPRAASPAAETKVQVIANISGAAGFGAADLGDQEPAGFRAPDSRRPDRHVLGRAVRRRRGQTSHDPRGTRTTSQRCSRTRSRSPCERSA